MTKIDWGRPRKTSICPSDIPFPWERKSRRQTRCGQTHVEPVRRAKVKKTSIDQMNRWSQERREWREWREKHTRKPPTNPGK